MIKHVYSFTNSIKTLQKISKRCLRRQVLMTRKVRWQQRDRMTRLMSERSLIHPCQWLRPRPADTWEDEMEGMLIFMFSKSFNWYFLKYLNTFSKYICFYFFAYTRYFYYYYFLNATTSDLILIWTWLKLLFSCTVVLSLNRSWKTLYYA